MSLETEENAVGKFAKGLKIIPETHGNLVIESLQQPPLWLLSGTKRDVLGGGECFDSSQQIFQRAESYLRARVAHQGILHEARCSRM